MKKVEKKKNYNFIIIGVIVVIVIIVCLFFLLGGKGKNNDESKKDEEDKQIVLTEKDIVDAYGMTANDAIEVVKAIYNSDNFEFSAKVNENSKYTVTVKNTITDAIYKYEVDPITESFYEIK